MSTRGQDSASFACYGDCHGCQDCGGPVRIAKRAEDAARIAAWAAYDAAAKVAEDATATRVKAQHDEEQARWAAADLRRVAKAHGDRPDVEAVAS